jgi:hypothetical protein
MARSSGPQGGRIAFGTVGFIHIFPAKPVLMN